MVIIRINVIAVLVCVVYGQSSYYIKDEAFKDKRCSGDNIIFTVSNTNTLQCALLCDKDSLCSGFILRTSDAHCTACQGGDGSLNTEDVGTEYFLHKQRTSTWGRECDVTRMCLGNQQCLDDVCVCTPGYSYNATSRTCQDGCSPYGSTFQRYRNHYVYDNNLVHYFHIDLSTCMNRCIDRPACVGIDYGSHDGQTKVCNLNKFTALDVPGAYRENARLDYYQRNC